jgi:hypothetical protein
MRLTRRTVWMVVAAVPTLVVAVLAVGVMLRFLAVRDLLGRWNFTVSVGNGTIVGHGRTLLVASSWSAKWQRQWPLVVFTPTVVAQDALLSVDHAGCEILAGALGGHPDAADIPMVGHCFFSTGQVVLYSQQGPPVRYGDLGLRLDLADNRNGALFWHDNYGEHLIPVYVRCAR